MNEVENPFASPEVSEQAIREGCWVDGDQLVIPCAKTSSLGHLVVKGLPKKCHQCGQPANEFDIEKMTLYTSGSFSLAPEFKISVPVCREHYRKWAMQSRWMNPLMFAGYLIIILLALSSLYFFPERAFSLGLLVILLTYLGFRLLITNRKKNDFITMQVTDFQKPYVWLSDYPKSVLADLPDWDLAKEEELEEAS